MRPIARLLTLLFATLLLGITPLRAQPSYSFGVVPQQTPVKLAREWGPLLAEVGRLAGVELLFQTAPDIPNFEERLWESGYDFAYMNPYHYVVYEQAPGYQALVRARDQGLTGILVVRSDSRYTTLADLAGEPLAFPAATAFAATILNQAELSRAGVPFTAKYVGSHDSVYLGVVRGLYPAGGGVERTLQALDPAMAAQLRVLATTATYPSHPIAAHPRVPAAVGAAVARAFIELSDTPQGKALLTPLQISGWQETRDREFDSVRELGINLLRPAPELLH